MASSAEQLDTTVVQITNLSPQCTKDQLKMLMAYLGRIKDIQLFPPEIPGVDPSTATTPRVAYVEYEDSSSAGVALHLSNTVFVDRAMMVVPVMSGKIPEATIAESLSPQAAAGMLQGQPTWPDTVVTQMSGSVLTTEDPELTAKGLPPYPPLPASTDPTLVQEIRRTIYVSDLDPKVTGEMLLKFFGQVGEIKYARMAGEDNAERRAAYIEYTDQRTILKALSLNNIVFSGRNISVQHSKTNVIKPIQKDEATERHMNEAMSKVKEAQKLISAAADTKKASSKSPSRRRSRSRSRDRGKRSRSKSRRSRSRSRRKRRSSRSRSRKRSRSRRRSRSPRRRRSRSRGKPAPFASSSRRSRSRDRRRSRTRSPLVIRRRRSRSRERKRSRTPPRSYLSRRSRSRSGSVHKSRRRASISPPPHRRSRSRDRSRERRRRKRRSRSSSLRRRSRSRSGSRHRSKRDRKRSRSRDRKEKKKSSRDKDREEKKKESKVKRDYDEEEKGYASADSDKSFGPKEPPKPVPVPNSGSDSSDKEEEGSDASGSDSDVPPTLTRESHQTVDMDMSD